MYAPQNKPSSFKENSNTLHWERRVFPVKSETKWKCSLYLSSNLLGDNRRAFNRSSGCLSCFQSAVVEAFSICWESWELKSFVPVSSKSSYWNCIGCESVQQISLRSRCVKVTLSSALMELPARETCWFHGPPKVSGDREARRERARMEQGKTVESEVERERCKLRANFSIPTQAKWSGVETDIPFWGWGGLETFQSWSSIVNVGKMNASPKSPEQKR